MIIYFTDRDLNIVAHASTELRNGYLIIDDKTTESIDNGVSIFECTVYANDSDELVLQDLLETGFYVLKSKDISTTSSSMIYDSFYQIITTDYNILEKQLTIYAEDCGLDLINTVVPAYTALSAMTVQNYAGVFIPSDWTAYNDDIGTRSLTLSWEGESTLTERLLSIAGHFDAELYYTFTIDKFVITEKAVHFIKKRGNQEPVANLRMNYDIENIRIHRSIENLATALSVLGGTDETTQTPIDLKGYSYSYTDDKGDIYTVDTTTGQMRCTTQMARWVSEIDSDGLIVKQYTFDTTNKTILAGQARAALQKLVYPEVNYEVDIIKLPEGIKIGDKINLVADKNQIYLEARVLELQISVVQKTITATLGEYLIKDSGISKYLAELSAKFSQDVKNQIIQPITIEISSSNGTIFGGGNNISTTLTAKVHIGNTVCTNYTELMAAIPNHSSYSLSWYVDGVYAYSGFSYTLTSSSSMVKISAQLELDF